MTTCPTCNQPIPETPKPRPSNALHRLREAKGLTMQQLAQLSGVGTRTTVFRLEHGLEVGLSSAVAIARALGVTVDELVE